MKLKRIARANDCCIGGNVEQQHISDSCRLISAGYDYFFPKRISLWPIFVGALQISAFQRCRYELAIFFFKK